MWLCASSKSYDSCLTCASVLTHSSHCCWWGAGPLTDNVAVTLWSPVSIQTHATHATQAPALRACVRCVRCVNEKRKQRKHLRWHSWLAASIEHSYWLALAFVAWKILHNDRLRQLRDLRLRTFVFCLRNFLAFIVFLAHFLFYLRIFSYPRPCVRLNGNRASVYDDASIR